MAGKGKLGKAAEKGKAKRIVKKSNEKVARVEITRGALRRLARRGGVKRISSNSYQSVRDFCDNMVVKITKHSIVYAEAAKRKTVTAMDVVYALKKNGRTLYGYGA